MFCKPSQSFKQFSLHSLAAYSAACYFIRDIFFLSLLLWRCFFQRLVRLWRASHMCNNSYPNDYHDVHNISGRRNVVALKGSIQRAPCVHSLEPYARKSRHSKVNLRPCGCLCMAIWQGTHTLCYISFLSSSQSLKYHMILLRQKPNSSPKFSV